MTAPPRAMSVKRWFALATIAHVMSSVRATARARATRLPVFNQTAAAAIAIQPKWKLGMAAYSLRMSEGWA